MISEHEFQLTRKNNFEYYLSTLVKRKSQQKDIGRPVQSTDVSFGNFFWLVIRDFWQNNPRNFLNGRTRTFYIYSQYNFTTLFAKVNSCFRLDFWSVLLFGVDDLLLAFRIGTSFRVRFCVLPVNLYWGFEKKKN
jgi:hypothetical protein